MQELVRSSLLKEAKKYPLNTMLETRDTLIALKQTTKWKDEAKKFSKAAMLVDKVIYDSIPW